MSSYHLFSAKRRAGDSAVVEACAKVADKAYAAAKTLEIIAAANPEIYTQTFVIMGAEKTVTTIMNETHEARDALRAPTPPAPAVTGSWDGLDCAKVAREALQRVSDIADGRDTLDGFPRSKDEKQRRLTEIKVLVLDAIRALAPPAPAVTLTQEQMARPNEILVKALNDLHVWCEIEGCGDQAEIIKDAFKAAGIMEYRCANCDGLGEWEEGPLPARSSTQISPDYRHMVCSDCEGKGTIALSRPDCGGVA